MKILSKLTTLAILVFTWSSQTQATIDVEDLEIEQIRIMENVTILSVKNNQSFVDSECNAGDLNDPTETMILQYVPESTYAGNIKDMDTYKMMWTQLNTAIALGRKVSLTTEFGIYNICFITGVAMH